MKGAHLAIEVARRAGIPLKIAGEVQPIYKAYFDTQVRPHLDGRFIEFVGEADHAAKNELLANSMAMLFPIQWNEPFGLVMIEAMSCGTPVVALEGGSVPEIVRDGVSGWVCRSVEEMADRVRHGSIPSASCRQHVAQWFTLDLMVSRYEAVYRRQVERRPVRRARRVASEAPRVQPGGDLGLMVAEASETDLLESASPGPRHPPADARPHARSAT
jgi:glycosyltransferase involved in cell wall biosynthesis